MKNYEIEANPTASRTGTVIMVKSTGRGWRVPPAFSGTVNDNFVTRALEVLDDVIFNIVKNEIESKV